MRKEPYRDYATEAFRSWAAAGCPGHEEGRKKYRGAIRADFEACAGTFAALGNDVCGAVRAVYMADAASARKAGDISGRVVRFSMEHYICERMVWEWLALARRDFAVRRGLRV